MLGQEQTLYRISRSMLRCDADCKDAVQEAVLKAWSRRHTLRDVSLFPTWLTRILINECRNLLRKQARMIPMEEIEAGVDPAIPNPDLQRALTGLDESLRLPLVLHYVSGFSVSEISQMLRIPSGTVKWRLSRARKALAKELNEEEEVWQA